MNFNGTYLLSLSDVSNANQTDQDEQLVYIFINLVGNLYLMPCINVLGIVFNIVCIVLLSSKRFKGNVYRYLVLKSACELIIVSIASLAPLVLCKTCSTYNCLFTQLLRLYGLVYINAAFANASVLSEIALAYDRLTIFKAKLPKAHFKRCTLLILLASALIFAPYLFSSRIVQINQTTFNVTSTRFGRSQFFIYYKILVNFVRPILCLTLLVTVNWHVLAEYKRYKLRRANLIRTRNASNSNNFSSTSTSNYMIGNNIISKKKPFDSRSLRDDVEKKLAFAIFSCCIIYAFNRLLSSISSLYIQLSELNNFKWLFGETIIMFSARMVNSIVFSFNLFILAIFDKSFRLHLKNFFKTCAK
jgi:hypothetical protein